MKHDIALWKIHFKSESKEELLWNTIEDKTGNIFQAKFYLMVKLLPCLFEESM